MKASPLSAALPCVELIFHVSGSHVVRYEKNDNPKAYKTLFVVALSNIAMLAWVNILFLVIGIQGEI